MNLPLSLLMFQTRIDKISEGKTYEKMYPSHQFDFNTCLYPLIKKFIQRTPEELHSEIENIKTQLELVCYDFPNNSDRNEEFLRQYLIITKLLIKILKRTINTTHFSFSWKESLENLLLYEDDPEFMVHAMIREIKRRNSFKSMILSRKKYPEFCGLVVQKFNQKKITAFIKKE